MINITFAKIRTLIGNTPRSKVVPEGTSTFAAWARNRFLAYDRPKYDCKWGRQIYTSHRGSCLRNWNVFVLLYRPVKLLYILTVAEEGKNLVKVVFI